MEKQRPGIIRDNKKRGEWAESVFAARAAENGLAVSRPSGDSETFDCVVGAAGKFVAVQVKCTIAKQHNAKGYICNLKCNNKKYRGGSFDFLAAYAILEDTWYLVPEKAIRGMSAITLCSTMPKYEKYREAWDLLREATGCEESDISQGQGEPGHPDVCDPEEADGAGDGANADGDEFLSGFPGEGWAGAAVSALGQLDGPTRDPSPRWRKRGDFGMTQGDVSNWSQLSILD